MEDERISFETAKLAKEKGFDIVTDLSFDGSGQKLHQQWNKYSGHKSFNPRLIQSLLQKWLREVHNLHPVIIPYFGSEYNDEGIEAWELRNIKDLKTEKTFPFQFRYDTYEEALEEALFEGLKLIP